MKKIILITTLLLLIVGGLVFLWPTQKNESSLDTTENNHMEEPLEIASELIIKQENQSHVYKIEKYEQELYQNEQLIDLIYLEDVKRLLYDFDTASNRLSFIYADQTLLVDFTANTLQINNANIQENDLFINKAGTLYVDIKTFSQYFKLEIVTIEEPLFSLQLDFSNNPIADEMTGIVEALPEYINMTWEAVYSRATDVSKINAMPGLDIISPVWYDLEDGQGALNSKRQEDYIIWAAENKITLWPAVTNGFDTDMTHELITSLDNRTNFIEKLVAIYSDNNYPGINIDFENIYKEDKEALSQFIGELTAAFHREGILVSMDVTFAGGSDTWSKCYDRLVLGQWVDYIIVMSYDQHWGSSPISGTVAGLNWLDVNIEKLTNEVDSNKIIMGIPFYMRVWFERPSSESVNKMRVTSDAITMFAMENILAEKEHTILWDEETGQNYISFIDHEDNAVKKIWIEDAESLRLKVAMVHKYNLKGIASWRRGYELESIWPVLEEALRR